MRLKMDISKKIVMRATVTIALSALVLFANFISIRLGTRYAVRVNFYDKLSVAYDIGGINGLKNELAKIRSRDNLKRELVIAEEFQKQLPGLKDPKAFVDNALAENNRKINLLIKLRSASIALIIAILGLRMLASLKLLRNRKA